MTKLICKIKSEPHTEIERTLRIASGDLAAVAKIDGRSDTSQLPESLIVVECPVVEVSAVMGDGTPTVDYPRQVPTEYARFFLRLPGPLYADDVQLTNGILTLAEREAIVASLRERDRRLLETGKSFGAKIAEPR